MLDRQNRSAPQRSLRAATILAATGAAALGLVAATPPAAPAGEASAPQPRPNVIVVMTDDQNVTQLSRETMPKTFRHLAKAGTRFTRSFVSSPLCCPSRAGFLTGQYPHNDGVYDNTPGYGALRDKRQTLFTWLDQAGYHTGHIGRFLLNYDIFTSNSTDAYDSPPAAPPAPPGVDDWFGLAQGETAYYNAPFSDNGTLVRAAPSPGGYTTEVLNNQALEFVRASAPASDPFFLWLAHLTPHTTNTDAGTTCGSGAALNAPGTYRQWRDALLPEPPSFGEKANRDKPLWIRSRAPIRKRQVAALTRAWRCSLAALTSVDRGVASLIRELKALGELDSTAIFFTSDNGYMYGEHRVVLQKIYPYEESWRVPLLARVPSAYLGGGEQPKFATQNVSNLDLTATVLDLTGANPCATVPAGERDQGCRPLDGRSLMPLLGAPGGAWPADRATLAEIGNRECGTVPGPSSGMKNQYDAIRTARYKYIELNRVNPSTGACDRPEYELYDLKRDPYELKNLAVNPAKRAPLAIQLNLANRLDGLTRCAGSSGRDAPLPDTYGSPRPLCE